MKNLSDRRQVLNDLLASRQIRRNDLNLRRGEETKQARLLRRRTIDITGKKTSTPVDPNQTPDSSGTGATNNPQTPLSEANNLTDQLNAPPQSEFAPLQPEENDEANSIESRSEEKQKGLNGEEKTDTSAEQNKASENKEGTEPPEATEETAQKLQQEKAAAAKREEGVKQQQENQQAAGANASGNDEIQNLQKEISDLQNKRKKIIDKANSELKEKVRKEWIKLIVSSVTLVSILYYLAKIKLMKRFLSREPQEAKDIAKQIKEKEDQIKKLKKARTRNMLLSPFRRAKA
jgi:hypothetical protein